jgi:hypothetical protein
MTVVSIKAASVCVFFHLTRRLDNSTVLTIKQGPFYAQWLEIASKTVNPIEKGDH